MRRILTVLLVVCVAMCAVSEPCFAGKKKGKSRGRGKQRGKNARQRPMKVTSKHTGVVVRMGEERQGVKRIGSGSGDLPISHSSAFGGQKPSVAASNPAWYAIYLARKKAAATNRQAHAFSGLNK